MISEVDEFWHVRLGEEGVVGRGRLALGLSRRHIDAEHAQQPTGADAMKAAHA